MNGFAESKVPNGKLVKARVRFGKKIVSVRFFGDFFLHPEEILDSIEQAFSGIPPDFDSVALQRTIVQLVQQKKAQLIGVNPADFVFVVREAIRNAQQ